MDFGIIAEAFVVVVVGGMGSLGGAFLAAILIGLLNVFGIQIFPNSTLVMMFLVMAVVLIFLALAVQFNSFRDPLVILAGSVPLAVFGALVFTSLKMPNPSILY